MYRQNPSAPRRMMSLAVPCMCTILPSGPVPSIDQSSTIWAVSPPTNTWRTFAFSGRPSLMSCSSMAVNSARSVMVRPSFATNTASGAYKAIIASIFPELNRLSRDGITPSGSVGSGKLSDIRGLLFVLVEILPSALRDERSSTRPSSPSARYSPVQSQRHRDWLLGRVEDGRREQDSGSKDPVVPGVEPEEFENKR